MLSGRHRRGGLAGAAALFRSHRFEPPLSRRRRRKKNAARKTKTKTKTNDDIQQRFNRLGLSHRAETRGGRLSVGEAQRVAVARALVNEPTLLLADEPTGSLDSASGEAVVEALEGGCAAGAALFLVTHDARIAARGRRLHLLDGQLVA